jgi:hypothetical protein
VEEGGFPSRRHSGTCVVQHTGEAVDNTPSKSENSELRSSSRSSSFALPLQRPKPNQLVLVIQRVTESPGRSLRIRLPEGDPLSLVTYWLTAAVRDTRGPSLPRPRVRRSTTEALGLARAWNLCLLFSILLRKISHFDRLSKSTCPILPPRSFSFRRRVCICVVWISIIYTIFLFEERRLQFLVFNAVNAWLMWWCGCNQSHLEPKSPSHSFSNPQPRHYGRL